jgi:hypothetical protein
MKEQVKKFLLAFLKTKSFHLVLGTIISLYPMYKAYCIYKDYNTLITKNRQLAGFLSKKEQALLEQKTEFSISNGELQASNKKLEANAAVFRSQYGVLEKEYASFVKDNRLKLIQYEKRIYSLNQKIKTTKLSLPEVKIVTKEGSCKEATVIEYMYSDPHKRVTFKTPNCLKQGGEELELNQSFVLYGEVYKQKDGLLKVSSITLKEVLASDPTKVLASAKLLDSEFNFIDEASEVKPTQDILTLGLAYTSTEEQAFNLGINFYSFYKLDLNMSLNYIYPRRVFPSGKIIYRPVLLGRKLNLGLSTSIGYDFSNPPIYMLGLDFVTW